MSTQISDIAALGFSAALVFTVAQFYQSLMQKDDAQIESPTKLEPKLKKSSTLKYLPLT